MKERSYCLSKYATFAWEKYTEETLLLIILRNSCHDWWVLNLFSVWVSDSLKVVFLIRLRKITALLSYMQ